MLDILLYWMGYNYLTSSQYISSAPLFGGVSGEVFCSKYDLQRLADKISKDNELKERIKSD